MSLRLIKFTRPFGALFPGETGGYPDPKASELLACDPPYGFEVDEDGNPIGGSGLALTTSGSDDSDDDDGIEWKFDARTDPFMTDGVSKQASQALHAVKLHSVAAVRKFIAETPEGESAMDRLNAIEGVTDAQAEKIVKLYGMTSEHSEE